MGAKWNLTRPLVIATATAMAVSLFATSFRDVAASSDVALSVAETSRAALNGLGAVGAGRIDRDALAVGTDPTGNAARVALNGTTVDVGPLTIALPTDDPPRLTADGLAVSPAGQNGLGVAVAPGEGGLTRLVTVAHAHYSPTPVHRYAYQVTPGPGTELRQLSSGEVVVVDTTGSATPPATSAIAADVDVAEYAAGLETARDGAATSGDTALAPGEAIVGGFVAPWSVDATGKPLPTSYELQGNILTQVVDTRGAVFPVVSDPVPLIVIGLLVAARAFVPAAARAFAATAIRAGAQMTTRGGFTTFAAFKAWAGNARAGHQWHHIVEQASVQFPRAAIHHPQNLIQIPIALHQRCINAWMSKRFAGTVAGRAFNAGSTVRSQIRGLSWTDQYNFGIQLLRFCGVDVR